MQTGQEPPNSQPCLNITIKHTLISNSYPVHSTESTHAHTASSSKAGRTDDCVSLLCSIVACVTDTFDCCVHIFLNLEVETHFFMHFNVDTHIYLQLEVDTHSFLNLEVDTHFFLHLGVDTQIFLHLEVDSVSGILLALHSLARPARLVPHLSAGSCSCLSVCVCICTCVCNYV
jgi:hypothetical protein